MRVWIVSKEWPYDGGYVEGVHSSRQHAIAALRTTLPKRDVGCVWNVDAFNVDGETVDQTTDWLTAAPIVRLSDLEGRE